MANEKQAAQGSELNALVRRCPTRHCDECEHYDLVVGTNYGGKDDKHCEIGHKPRWYAPKGPMDDDWGHKRRCEDFVKKPDA